MQIQQEFTYLSIALEKNFLLIQVVVEFYDMVTIDLMTIDNFTVVIIMRHKHVDHLINCTCIQGLERFFTLMI